MQLASPEQVVARIPEASLGSAAAVLTALERALPYAAGGAYDDAMIVFHTALDRFEPMVELMAWFDPRAVLMTLHDPGFLRMAAREFGLLADAEPTWSPGDPVPAGFDDEAALADLLARVRAATGRPL